MTNQEIEKKLDEARKILSEKEGFFGAELDKLYSDFIKLEIDNAAEIWPLLSQLFEEIRPENLQSYEHDPAFPKREIFMFSWKSKRLGRPLTIKFALNGGHFFYISLRSE